MARISCIYLVNKVVCSRIRTSFYKTLYDSVYVTILMGGGEIAQLLVSLSFKRAVRVRAWLDPLVSERWNSITVLLTCSHQCRRLVKKRPSMCHYV